MNNRKIILDIDSVGDDILALFFAALHPDFDLLAVSTVSGAAGSIEQATRVALHTVEVTGKQIPVYRGAEGPLVKEQKNLLGDPVNFFASLEEKFEDRLVEMNKSEETKLVEERICGRLYHPHGASVQRKLIPGVYWTNHESGHGHPKRSIHRTSSR